MPSPLGRDTNHSFTRLTPFEFDRRDLDANKVDILFRCVRHSGSYQPEDDQAGTVRPCNPDHDAVGRFPRIDASCRPDEQQRCNSPNSGTTTNNAPMEAAKHAAIGATARAFDCPTSIIVRDGVVWRITDPSPSTGSTRILCTGIVNRSPLQHRRGGQGDRFGSIGLDGIAKLARARRSTTSMPPGSEAEPADLLPETDIRGHIDIDDIDFRHATDTASLKHEQPTANA